MKFKFGLLPRVVLAIALGVACGFFLPGWAARPEPPAAWKKYSQLRSPDRQPRKAPVHVSPAAWIFCLCRFEST